MSHGTALCIPKHQQKKRGSGPRCVSQPAVKACASQGITQGVCREVLLPISIYYACCMMKLLVFENQYSINFTDIFFTQGEEEARGKSRIPEN